MRTYAPRDRSGFTLIELLVVIFIIGVLVALLMPAISSGKGASRRVQCINNLKQIALGVYNYDSTYQAIPSLYNGSFLPRPRSAIDEFHFHSWRTAVIPFIEASPLYNQINMNLPATVVENQTPINVSLNYFLCPSSVGPEKVPDIFAWNDGAFPKTILGKAARGDYEAVGGIRVDPPTSISSDLADIRFGAWGEPTYNTKTGASLRYRAAHLADITDGVSSTILIGEKAGRPDVYEKGKLINPYPYNPKLSGSDQHQAAWGISTHFPWLVAGRGQTVNSSNATGIYSFHPGGANAAFADGSVRFLKETMAPQMYKALITRSEGEVVGEGSY